MIFIAEKGDEQENVRSSIRVKRNADYMKDGVEAEGEIKLEEGDVAEGNKASKYLLLISWIELFCKRQFFGVFTRTYIYFFI